MRPPPVLGTLVALAVAAACSSPARMADAPARDTTSLRDTVPAVVLEREVRYYVDEKGAVWDDRGRKYDKAP